MNWKDIDFRPSDLKVRQFVGVLFVTLSALAAEALYSGHQTRALSMAIIAGLIGSAGVLIPGAVRPLLVGISVLTFPIGWTVSSIVLGFIFYCVLTPLALILRTSGHDPLRLGDQSHEPSLWKIRQEPEDERNYFRQF